MKQEKLRPEEEVDTALANFMVMYGYYVGLDRVYLGVLDLVLLALLGGKDVVLVVHVKDNDATTVQNVPLRKYLEDTVSGIVLEDLNPDPDFSSESTWFVAAVRADHKATSLSEFFEVNHFIPAWHKSQLPESDWKLLTGKAKLALADKQLKISKQIHGCMSSATKGQNSEALASLLEMQEIYEDEESEFHDFEFHDFFISTVPGDGNCCLWTLLALRGGVDQLENKPSKEEVQQLREDCSMCF